MLCESAPKTAPREGMGMNFLEVVVGMLGSCRDGAVGCGRARCWASGDGARGQVQASRTARRDCERTSVWRGQAGQRGSYNTIQAEAEAKAEAEE